MKNLLCLIASFASILPTAWAQTAVTLPVGTLVPVLVMPAPLPHSTVLAIQFGKTVSNNQRVAFPPTSRVRVPPGEQVSLLAIVDGIYPASQWEVQWTKDDAPISGATSLSLAIPSASSADCGRYSAVMTNLASFPEDRWSFSSIALDVVPEGNIGNVSSRLNLKPGDDVQVFGFVVTGNTSKTLLIRAVGPSLSNYGVANPVAKPQIALFDGQGNSFPPPPQGAIAVVTPSPDWTALFQQVGAFPLIGAEQQTPTAVVTIFPPGAYTVHVTDAAALGGTVLVEVYEVDQIPYASLPPHDVTTQPPPVVTPIPPDVIVVAPAPMS